MTVFEIGWKQKKSKKLGRLQQSVYVAVLQWLSFQSDELSHESPAENLFTFSPHFLHHISEQHSAPVFHVSLINHNLERIMNATNILEYSFQ